MNPKCYKLLIGDNEYPKSGSEIEEVCFMDHYTLIRFKYGMVIKTTEPVRAYYKLEE